MAGQVVDTESAREFMREALEQISEPELHAFAASLEVKHATFASLLSRERLLEPLDRATITTVLRQVFATRRRVTELLSRRSEAELTEALRHLLYASDGVDARIQAFCDRLDGVAPNIRFDLASEILHFSDPDRYWLWTRWIWDPQTRTGALPLVTMDDFVLDDDSVGAMYLRVGRATAFVRETGEASGFTRIGGGAFGIDVFLACVYAVYVFTTVKMRMTQEFNRVIPALPELCRRFLGVHAT